MVLRFLDFAKRNFLIIHMRGGEVGLSNDTSAQIYLGLQIDTRQQNTSLTVICMMRKMKRAQLAATAAEAEVL